MATSVAKIATAGGSGAILKSSAPFGNCRASRTRLSSVQTSGISEFSQLVSRPAGVEQRRKAGSGKISAVATTQKVLERFSLPTWAEFEMGHSTVYWETATGQAPRGGSSLTIYFNPFATELEARTEYGIGFNGGFNQPIMCGGEPRIMTSKQRGIACTSFYSIKINVPLHALTLEFSFTDGTSWDGPYKIEFVVPDKWKKMPIIFFNEGLAETLSAAGACESAIYPEQTFIQDRCSFPANLTIEGGNRCELEWVLGCTDPENPFYNPLANVEDGSCPYFSDSDTE
ncbi:unnamed protein product [Calypogeia fissa]